jgi:hypothetical protein
MKGNEKANAGHIGSNKYLGNEFTMTNDITKQIEFQYYCSFCWRTLPNGGIRFDGIGACPLHFALARKLIDGLREHTANYFKSWGVKR